MKIRYDRQEFDVDPGPAYDLLTPASLDVAPITGQTVREALLAPIASPPCERMFSAGQQVTIVVPDITRYAAADIYLPPLIDLLGEVGIEGGDITILFATGTHRGHSEEERRAIVGDRIPQDVVLLDHDARGDDLVPLGMSLMGEDILVNRAVVDCDRLIVTGAVGLHYLAGYGGGRKAILPGVASLKDATRFHLLSLNPDGPGRHPNIGAGIMEENPMSDMAFAAMALVKPALSINVVVDRTGAAVGLFAGDPVKAYRKACDLTRRLTIVPIDRLYDAVLVSAGGFPKDINFIQAHKAYDNGVRAVKPGGKVFLAAACRDGMGNDTFMSYIRKGSARAIDAALREAFHINGQTAMATLEKSERYETVLLSSLDEETVRTLGMRPASSADAFFREVRHAFSAGDGLVIAEGGALLPSLPLP